MRQRTLSIVILAAVVLASGTLAGCNGTKERMATLEANNNNLRGEIQRKDQENQYLQGKLDSAEVALQNKDEEIGSLRAEMSSQGTAPVMATNPVMKLEGDVLFTSGKDTLTAQGKAKLSQIISALNSQYAGQKISVEGHTDSSPLVRTRETWKTNLWLSANRARSVADYLMANGIPEDRIRIVGHGVGKRSGGSKSQDRRVEIVVLLR